MAGIVKAVENGLVWLPAWGLVLPGGQAGNEECPNWALDGGIE